MDHAEQVFRDWAQQDGLISLFINADHDQIEEPFRLWWFYCDGNRISPAGGLCDEEVVLFFSARHELTMSDRLLMDSQS